MIHHFNRAGVAILCIVLALALGGCTPPTSTPTVNTGLYMTDTNTGKVFTYDPSTHTVSSTSMVTTAPAAGPIYFYKGIGYIAVGDNTYGNACGVYYFNPSDSVPKAVQIGSKVSAQFIAFYSTTKAYVSVADYGATGGVYTFDPSNPSVGLVGPISQTDAAGLYLQQIVVGPDSMVYVANNSLNGGTDEVLQIDPSTDTVKSTTAITSSHGTTALASGSYNGAIGVFVGNIVWDSGTSSYTGTVDFLNTTSQVLASSLLSTPASRLIYLASNKKLVTTSYAKSYLADVSSSSVTFVQLGSGLSGADLAAKDNLIYVGSSTYPYSSPSTLNVFDTSGVAQSYSPISFMGSGEGVAGLGFYQN